MYRKKIFEKENAFKKRKPEEYTPLSEKVLLVGTVIFFSMPILALLGWLIFKLFFE